MDSVSKLRRSAQFVLGIFSIWAVLLLTACGPELGKVPDSTGKDPAKSDPASPETPDPAPTVPPETPPETSVPLVRALWEKPNPVAGPTWTSYAFAVVRDYGGNLLAGSGDVTNFCPAYHSLNREQKISFWVYLVSAVTKYESGFSPVNRYKES